MRRVDRRTNALQTDQPTDRQTDRASYRGALSHLKTKLQFMKVGLKGNSFPSAPVKKVLGEIVATRWMEQNHEMKRYSHETFMSKNAMTTTRAKKVHQKVSRVSQK